MPYKRNRFIYSFFELCYPEKRRKNSNFVLCTQKLFFLHANFLWKMFEYEFQFAIENKKLQNYFTIKITLPSKVASPTVFFYLI